MFAYDQVKERPKLLRAMTSLTQEEFEQLLPSFHKAWETYVQQAYVDREGRQRQYGGGKPEETLVTFEDKLLFILYYVKVYPLQEILAFEFGMGQSTANEWIHILSDVLKKVLISKYLSGLCKLDSVIVLKAGFETQLRAPRLSIPFGMSALSMTRQIGDGCLQSGIEFRHVSMLQGPDNVA